MKQKHLDRELSVRPNGTLRIQTINTEPTMAQQQFKDECDINNILRKHGHDPVAFQALTRPGGIYADFSEISDYHTMLNTVVSASEAFASLPAHLRARFANDPGKLLDFVQDNKNYDEGVELGLVPKKQKQEPASTNNDPNDDPKPVKQNKTKTPDPS